MTMACIREHETMIFHPMVNGATSSVPSELCLAGQSIVEVILFFKRRAVIKMEVLLVAHVGRGLPEK